MATTKEYGLGEFTFPRGWFMVADATAVTAIPKAVRFFGTDLALYRGKASGQAILLDAYCPHMGTHIAKNTTSYAVLDGQVEGDSIRCPYHAWRFGPDGKCNHIPYYDGPIPKAASVRSWPVMETMGCVYVWYDPEGGEPDYAVPSHPEWDDPQWVRWKIDDLGKLHAHPQEIIDNITDLTHLGPIHGSTVEYFENEFAGPRAIQRQGGGHRTLVSADGSLLHTDTWYTGPGILYSSVRGFYDAIMYITHTPVEDGSVHVWHGLMVKSAHPVATAEDVANARLFQEASRLAFAQDFEVWSSKRPCLQVLQLPTDGPFHKARAWYKQFFQPRSKAAELCKQVDGFYTVKGMPAAPASAKVGQRY
jgi:3-ketosteroid 9alpha-monooxygenase subunit A